MKEIERETERERKEGHNQTREMHPRPANITPISRHRNQLSVFFSLWYPREATLPQSDKIKPAAPPCLFTSTSLDAAATIARRKVQTLFHFSILTKSFTARYKILQQRSRRLHVYVHVRVHAWDSHRQVTFQDHLQGLISRAVQHKGHLHISCTYNNALLIAAV